jgi:hypothetical protein
LKGEVVDALCSPVEAATNTDAMRIAVHEFKGRMGSVDEALDLLLAC